MKSLLLGMTVAAFATSSAYAGGCSYGMAKMSEGKPMKHVAQSHKVQTESKTNLEFAGLKDAWLKPFLNKA